MCGIAGVIQKNEGCIEALDRAHSVQKHRGPDAKGSSVFHVNHWNIGLAHQRLSIIDLSELGKQPMLSPDGSNIIIYNGEIYNYKELRVELEKLGCHFISDSDTEVVLAALKHWGPKKALQKFNGMWAFAWLDLKNNKLILSRDRLGIKPLYFYKSDNRLYFASEIKTILEMSQERFDLNYQAVGEYLVQSLLDTSDETFFMGINKLPPANYCIIDLNTDLIKPEFRSYWKMGNPEICSYTEEELAEQIRELFFDSVKLRMRSDVPVGVLLSGGIDSSSIAAAMKHSMGNGSELKLISAVSNDSRYDESKYIDIMANYLKVKVDKVPLVIEPDKIFDYMSQTTWFNDEPIGSLSNVAHYLLMEKAKELGVTVVLSGQGADELLCGYRKYLGFYIKQLYKSGHLLGAGKTLFGFFKQNTIINQLHIGEARRYLPGFTDKTNMDIRGCSLDEFSRANIGLQTNQTVQERQILDLTKFSVPVLNHYEDRMSMAWSREVRVPFLDYRLVEKLVPLPVEYKLNQGWTKYIFRKAMKDYLPEQITWRKDKQGFVNPQSQWFKEELKQNVEEIFNGDSYIYKYGLVNKQNLNTLYQKYCSQPSGKETIWFRNIFNPIALEIWLRRFEKSIRN